MQGSVLDLPRFGGQIFVKTLKGTTLTLETHPRMTIADLKELIERKHGIPSEKQSLIFAGRQLEDRNALYHHNIMQVGAVDAFDRCNLSICR